MKSLSETWFTEGYIDFELQKYRLLAYLQDVKKYFSETKLYPQLSDMVLHYNNLIAFRENKKLMQEHFPRRVDKIDRNNMELVYENLLADDNLMQEMEEIINYAVGEIKSTIEEGAEIYEFVERKIKIEPVGIEPLYKKEGYVLMHSGHDADVRVYNFSVTLFEHSTTKYSGIKMEYLETKTKSLVNTYEQIKIDIIRNIRTLPNPAVYVVDFPLEVPYMETYLPVAKRSFVKYIHKG